MAHEKHIVDRLSTRLPSLLPEWIQDEAPIFEAFLQAYFEFLESEIIVLESKSELEGIRLEDGTSEIAASLLLEAGTNPASPDADSSKLLVAQQNTENKELEPFQVGEYVFGQTNGSLAKIKVINGNTLIVDSISGTGFASGESIVGRDGNQTGVIKTYKENSVVANNRLLDYSDIDDTLETFLQYFQKDFIPSLDLKDTQNPRLTLKNIGSLYKQKGTADSVKFLMRLLYGEDAEIKYPVDETVVLSESKFNEERRMTVKMTVADKVPVATDKIKQFSLDDSTLVTAEAVVESVTIIDQSNDIYSVSMSYLHRGEFEFNRLITFVDRDGVSENTATVLGIVSTVDNSNGSVYLSQEDSSGDILNEDGTGILMEKTSLGSMYDIQDLITFSGGKTDTDAVTASSNVTGLSRGGIEKIYIEDAGQNYSAGDIVVFDDSSTGGNGAEAVIGSTGDELILEDALATEQYEFSATANQTVFGGITDGQANRDLHGKPIALSPAGNVEVHINGVPQAENTFTFALDGITFTTNPNLSSGDRVEIFSDKSRLIYEDDEPILLNRYINKDNSTVVTDQRIRNVQITNPGAGYEKMPTVFPGGYLYFSDTSGYQVGETVTGGTSNATGVILRIEPNRLVIRRTSANINVFASSEAITGSSSSTVRTNTLAKVSGGTGAKLFAWSSQIGAVEKLTISDQGYNFDGDAIIGNTSFHNMLITGPSASLTKGLTITGSNSGTTAVVQSYDSQRQILKYTSLNGQFRDDETVTYNSGNASFKVLKDDNYTARGKVAGEGLLNDNFLSDQGFVSGENAHIQDSKFYQSHSYVVKVGQSINKYRGILKELVHPAGHVFFGEVAVKSQILSSSLGGRFEVDSDNQLGIISTEFVPTVVIPSFPTNNVLVEDLSNEFPDGSTRDAPVRVMLETGDLLENEESRDNVAITNRERLFFILTTKAEVDGGLNLVNQLKHAITNTTINGLALKDAHHVNVLSVRKFIDSDTQSIISSRVSGSKFPTTGTFNAVIQKSPRRDGALSVSNIVDKENDYYVPDLTGGVPERGAVAVRPSDSGLVFQLYNPEEELLILEDGSKILNEEPLNFLRHEPFDRDLHGHKILLEDDSGSIMVEDDTVPEERAYFVTERTIELSNPFMYYENTDRIIMEDGDALLKEDAGESVHTFVPIGPTFRTLNKIAFQNCYKISYYLLDETSDTNDEDKILMEDGISAILSEESKEEGLNISQLDSLLGNTYINDLDDLARKRTNIGFSSYVNSSNVTNSTLQSL